MNTQSLRNKIEDVQCYVINEECDILLLTETWLNDKETFLYNLKNYKAVHSCRKTRGGGASIYIKDTIQFRELDKSNDSDKINWACIGVGDQNLKISVVYKPPSISCTELQTFLESVLLKYPKRHLVVGDFNVNLLDHSKDVSNYKNLITLSNFKIHNVITEENATRVTSNTKSIIDHVLSDRFSNLSCRVTIVNTSLSDHKSLSITIKENIKIIPKKTKQEVKIIDYQRFQNTFRQKLSIENVSSFRELIDLITKSRKESLIIKVFNIRENNEWINREVLEMMRQRDLLYNRKIHNPGNLRLDAEFKDIKNRINNRIKSLKNRYFKGQWERAGTDPKKQWRFINRFFKNKISEGNINCIEVNGRQTGDSVSIANGLNNHFSGIGETIVNDLEREMLGLRRGGVDLDSCDEIVCNNSMEVELTDRAEILETILELKQNSAPGHDEVSVRDVINLKEDLADVLTKLVNNVLVNGIFPNELKMSKISPIFKSGNKRCLNNYRPISVLSIFSKILEKIIKKRMLKHINKNIKMDQYQYGFLKNSSTLSATIDFVNHVSRALDAGMIVTVVYVDLSKAFDVVSIRILLKKLEQMGFRGMALSIVKTYLEDRCQYVKTNNINSELRSSTHGVPQGSVLGPLLYSLYVLNLKNSQLKARYFTFADDTALVYTGMNETVMCREINSDLGRYVNWLYSNRLKINIEKTKYMVFIQKNKHIGDMNIQINKITLEKVTQIKYLGLMIDDKLNWNEHLEKITNKIVPMISYMFRCRNYLTRKTKLMIYSAFFLSHFRYLMPVWGMCNKTKFNKMQILQNKILKILYNYERLVSTDLLYSELEMHKLGTLLQIEQCKLIYNILNNHQKTNCHIIISNQVHNYETRIISNIYQINTRTDIGLYNPIVNASKIFNKLPREIKTIDSYNIFVKRMKAHFFNM